MGRDAEGRRYPYESAFGGRNRHSVDENEHEETKDTASTEHSSGPRVAGGLQPSGQYIDNQRPVNGLDYALGGKSTVECIKSRAGHACVY